MLPVLLYHWQLNSLELQNSLAGLPHHYFAAGRVAVQLFLGQRLVHLPVTIILDNIYLSRWFQQTPMPQYVVTGFCWNRPMYWEIEEHHYQRIPDFLANAISLPQQTKECNGSGIARYEEEVIRFLNRPISLKWHCFRCRPSVVHKVHRRNHLI